MTTSQTSSQDLSVPRDETAASSPEDLPRGLIHTQVAAAVAWGMIALFLGLLFGVPLLQVVAEVRSDQRPGVANLFAGGRFPTRGELKQYEDSLQEQSGAVRFFQPRTQELLTSWGRCGTTQIVVGQDAWLFYRPGIDSVTGPGFLDPQTLRRRARNLRDATASESVVPDPRPAILEFKRQIEAAGAQLILLPIPDKASLQAAELCGRRIAAAPAQNISFPEFVREMRAAGVEVFDPSPAAVQPGETRYLAQDTHWTPQWMDEVAGALAAVVRRQLAKVDRFASHHSNVNAYTKRSTGGQSEDHGANHLLRLESLSVAGLGDLTEMLRLTDEQQVFLPQKVTVHRVLDADGRPVRASSQAEVLLLGDSFTNIFSASPMGWGDSAGLAEHLAYHLQRPIDWIARNDAGAHATREMLSSQVAQGRNRLAGKRVVIWQFAARELALGDWKAVRIAPR